MNLELDKGNIMSPKAVVFCGDHLLGFLTRRVTKRASLLALLYTGGGFGVCVLLAFLKGSVLPDPSTPRIELLEDYVSLFSFCVILPTAVVLGLRFYHKLASLRTLVDEGILEPKGMTTEAYLSRMSQDLTSPWLSWTALGIAVAANIAAAIYIQGKWYSVPEGIVSLWFRLFGIANYYMLFSFLLKGFAAVRVIRRLFDSEHIRIALQPMHRDGSAGLRPVTLVCVSMNYVLFVLFAYAYTTALLETSITHRLILILPAISVYPFIAGYLFITPLLGAHRSLTAEKDEALRALNRAFTPKYREVFGESGSEGVRLESAQDLATLERLHRYVSRMPAWPIDLSIAGRLFLIAGLPLLLAILVEGLKRYLP